MSYKVGYTHHQLVKFTAEKIAITADRTTFAELYAARALAWGTAGYPAAANAFDQFMGLFHEPALAIVIDAMSVQNHGKQVEDAIFQSIKDNYGETAQDAPVAEKLSNDPADYNVTDEEMEQMLAAEQEFFNEGDESDNDES